MKDKLFNDYVKQETESSKQYYKAMGRGNVNIKERIPNENLDMVSLLSKLGLIEENMNNRSIINDFHDYLFKFGIEMEVADKNVLLWMHLKTIKLQLMK